MSSGSPLPERQNEPTEQECCICMDSLACAKVLPCNHSAFCPPCISVVHKNKRPCPLCRTPINGIEIDGVPVNQGDASDVCCLCGARPSIVTLMSCRHSSFCVPCIFSRNHATGTCPLCDDPIVGFQTDRTTSVEHFSTVMGRGDLFFIQRGSVATVGEFADFFDVSIPYFIHRLFINWVNFPPSSRR